MNSWFIQLVQLKYIMPDLDETLSTKIQFTWKWICCFFACVTVVFNHTNCRQELLHYMAYVTAAVSQHQEIRFQRSPRKPDEWDFLNLLPPAFKRSSFTSKPLSVKYKTLKWTDVIVPGHNLRNINTNKVQLMLIFLSGKEDHCWCKPFQLVCAGLFSATFHLETKIH